MAETGAASPGHPTWWASPWRWVSQASLYVRVLVVNTSILCAAAVLLVISPATVSFPAAPGQIIELSMGLGVMAVANAVMVRQSFQGLDQLVGRMREVDVLQQEQRLVSAGCPEVRTLIAGFNTMLDRLQAERRDSTQSTLNALEEERRRVGLELHDEIGQRLTGTLLQLERIREDAPPALRVLIGRVQDEQRSTMDQVGALAWQLRPSVVEDLGLLQALTSLVDAFDGLCEGAIVADLPARLPPMSVESEITVYRIAQEAVTNAVRHADAELIRLEVEVDEHGLHLAVLDDGSSVAPQPEGSGIRGMRERALLIGARLTIHPERQAGWAVVLDVPHESLSLQEAES
ncbi:MAG: sensor histidine kinase [Nocardioides sp.]